MQRKKPTTKGNLWKAVIGTYRNYLTTLLRIAKDEYYKTHLKENKKDLETIWERNYKEIIKVKTKNNLPINSY